MNTQQILGILGAVAAVLGSVWTAAWYFRGVLSGMQAQLDRNHDDLRQLRETETRGALEMDRRLVERIEHLENSVAVLTHDMQRRRT